MSNYIQRLFTLHPTFEECIIKGRENGKRSFHAVHAVVEWEKEYILPKVWKVRYDMQSM